MMFHVLAYRLIQWVSTQLLQQLSGLAQKTMDQNKQPINDGPQPCLLKSGAESATAFDQWFPA